MSTELLESVLVDVSRTAQFPITIAWHGGEPLLAGKAFFRRAIELVNQHFEPGTVKNSVQTNGVLLDDEWLKMFQSAGFSLGISLDGPATIHDVKRVYRSGLGSFSRVERSAKRAKALGIPLNAICVVGDLHEGKAALVLQSFERLGIGNCNIQPSYSLTPRPQFIEASIFVDFAIEFIALWCRRTGPHINVMLIDNFLESLLTGAGSDCVFSGRCSQLLAISHDGDVRPCSRPFEGAYSSLGTMAQGLRSISSSAKSQNFRREDLVAQNRSNCEFSAVCNQGCPQHRVDEHGNHSVSGGNVFCGCTNSSGIGYNKIWKAIAEAVQTREFTDLGPK